MKPRCVVVIPRFEKGSFTGYDHVGGNVYLDTAGHMYALVRIEDYNAMRDQFETVLANTECFITHALELGYAGEGSTKGMFEQALKDIQDVLNDKPVL